MLCEDIDSDMIDQLIRQIVKQYKPKTFDTKLYTSIRCKTNFDDYPIVFFNGHKETMLKKGWWHEYTLPQKDWWSNNELKNRYQK